jgi:hypothetical protein
MNPVETTRRSDIHVGDSKEPGSILTRLLLIGRFPTTAIKLMGKEFSAI